MPNLLFWVFGLALFTLIITVFWMYRRLLALQQQNKKLILAQTAKKMPAMTDDELVRYKLDPHLLKNALNTIQSHAYQSYYALDKLSNVLDFILYESDLKWVKLKDEIAFAKNLIEINRLKVSPLFDLHVRDRIPKDAEELLVPRFISINPIENAFKHADIQKEESFISIAFEVKNNKFSLHVSNKIADYANSNKAKGGMGNESFLKRLNSIYGDNYTLEIEQKDNVYTIKLELELTPYDQMYTS